MTYYYEVLVCSPRFHGKTPLTYHAYEKLLIGQVVEIPMQRFGVLGVITAKISGSSLKTKPIISAVTTTPLPPQSVQLVKWLAIYYPASLGQISTLLVPNYVKGPVKETIVTTNELAVQPKLTADQTRALQQIRRSSGSVLLHGDTATGKTRVYLELIQDAIKAGKSALVLTPEISLTPQLLDDLQRSLSTTILVAHSNLTPAKRRALWHTALNSSKPIVVIGPRSALFLPIHNLGLIVIDESHEPAYKQEQAPRYQATRVAGRLGNLHNAQVIFGSATPSITDYYTFAEKHLPVVRMTEPATINKAVNAHIDIISLRDRTLFERSQWLSKPMLSGIERAMDNKQQALVFLNQRGSARTFLCQNCGWQALCPRCDLPLVYHGDSHSLRCHTCGYHAKLSLKCPTCGSTDTIFKGIGTKALALELEHLFPDKLVRRFDTDNAKADSLEQQYADVKSGKIDILVGTQMLIKGLDLPRLAFVGVVTADSTLSFPDYSSQERSFQQLTQIIGRVGRGHASAHIVIQTYHPQRVSLQQAMSKSYGEFYKTELEERRQFHFPPFYYLLKLRVSRATSRSAESAADKLRAQLESEHHPMEIIGPSPAFKEKSQEKYHWQLVIKAKNRSVLTDITQFLPANWTYDLDPSDLL